VASRALCVQGARCSGLESCGARRPPAEQAVLASVTKTDMSSTYESCSKLLIWLVLCFDLLVYPQVVKHSFYDDDVFSSLKGRNEALVRTGMQRTRPSSGPPPARISMAESTRRMVDLPVHRP